MNRWNIPASLEDKVRKRNKNCVYCRKVLKEHSSAKSARKNTATWEHIDNNVKHLGANVVRCCGACNSSKGPKTLLKWFESEYCREKNINERTVSGAVKDWLKQNKY
jgi:hypothetical protein